jgi:hypothetical protein
MAADSTSILCRKSRLRARAIHDRTSGGADDQDASADHEQDADYAVRPKDCPGPAVAQDYSGQHAVDCSQQDNKPNRSAEYCTCTVSNYSPMDRPWGLHCGCRSHIRGP